MLDTTARAIAFIAGKLVTGSASTSVLDRRDSRRASFTGEVTHTKVTVFDTEQGCSITGRVPEGLRASEPDHPLSTEGRASRADRPPTGRDQLWLFHHGSMRCLRLVPQDADHRHWFGFDYASNHHFELTVDDSGAVRLLDYQDGIWRTYEL